MKYQSEEERNKILRARLKGGKVDGIPTGVIMFRRAVNQSIKEKKIQVYLSPQYQQTADNNLKLKQRRDLVTNTPTFKFHQKQKNRFEQKRLLQQLEKSTNAHMKCTDQTSGTQQTLPCPEDVKVSKNNLFIKHTTLINACRNNKLNRIVNSGYTFNKNDMNIQDDSGNTP